MCRYLLRSRGADGRKADTEGYFPILLAVIYGHLELLQWLYSDGGAHEDIRRPSSMFGLRHRNRVKHLSYYWIQSEIFVDPTCSEPYAIDGYKDKKYKQVRSLVASHNDKLKNGVDVTYVQVQKTGFLSFVVVVLVAVVGRTVTHRRERKSGMFLLWINFLFSFFSYQLRGLWGKTTTLGGLGPL